MAVWKTPPSSVTPVRGTRALWTGGFQVLRIGDVLGMVHEGGFAAQARGPRHLGNVVVISVSRVHRDGA